MTYDCELMINKNAFTLIELMVASAILVAVLSVFLVTFNRTLNLAEQSRDDYLAGSALRMKLEEMRSHNFSSIKADYGAGGTPGNTFDIAGLAGKGSIAITDQPALYGGGENLAIAAAGWSGRAELFPAVVYDNKMWILGGYDGGYKNDVWWTDDLDFSDGQTWNQAVTVGPIWSARCGHTALVFKNKMWILGGFDGASKNDVWYSTDGINWIKATDSAAWSGRNFHTSLVYDDKMWVIGGMTGVPKNDVWYSTDGVTWAQATAAANWPARCYHTSLVYDNKMWVMGGFAALKNDVWWTDDLDFSDGQTWNQAVTVGPIWSARCGLTSLVYDNRMWIISGEDAPQPLNNDIWYSTDGVNWVPANLAAGWSPRAYHASLVYDNKIWVLGGYDGAYKNDVWYSVGYDRLLEATITVCWQAKDGRIIGEDDGAGGGIALNGILDGTEDINGNGELDSPVKFRGFITDKEKLTRIYLGGS